jgi:integrase
VEWHQRLGLHYLVGRTALPRHPERAHVQVDARIQQVGLSPARPLPDARPHDLRHLHVTTLLLAGAPVHVVAARLGRADPAVTLRVYSHALREHTAGVGDVFAEAVQTAVSKSVIKPSRKD